tara:strand:+ start:102 stop:383 length:282 start_codon:yes stop_codon:yes gene_type:complete
MDMLKKDFYNIKKNIMNNIKKMNKNEYIEIFKIIKKNDIPYTENLNGIFINLNIVDDKILFKINNFINFIMYNNTELIEKEKKMNDIKDKLNS